MDQRDYDLVVIGSGPAGEKGAARAAYFGKRVALVEKENHLGGAAANTGTLPSKTLRETALFLSGFKQRQLAGVSVAMNKTVHISDFMAHEREVVDTERLRIRSNIERHGVNLYRGTATVADANTVVVKPDRCPEIHLRADKILVATGSYPFRPAIFPFHDPRILDSDTILALDKIPARLAVVGGGVIGCEYACMFQTLGTQVVVIEKRDVILGSVDHEISHDLQSLMEAQGTVFHLGTGVTRVEDNGVIRLFLESGEQVETDAVLVSSGRCGQTGNLGLEALGVVINKRGQIQVNEQYQTAVPSIYAAGDCIGGYCLASTSMEQGRLAVSHAFNLNYGGGLSPILPYGIYTIPECSMAGPTEAELIEKKIPYVAGRSSYGGNARGQIIGDRTGFIKLLFHAETRKLLAVHVMGEGATELVHIGLTALLMGATVDLFIFTCYNYPTLSEVYKYASYDALRQLEPRAQQVTQPQSGS
ncbi:MAG: Si-specific NAD(P)(+) transhydrogenase [Gemmataceae bacterium]|jgi:NAD(P) transhydrogenase